MRLHQDNLPWVDWIKWFGSLWLMKQKWSGTSEGTKQAKEDIPKKISSEKGVLLLVN